VTPETCLWSYRASQLVERSHYSVCHFRWSARHAWTDSRLVWNRDVSWCW